MSGIALLIIAGILFAFRGKIFSTLSDDMHTYSQDIVITIKAQDGINNNILGRYVSLTIEEEKTYQDIDYENIVLDLKNRQQEEIFALTTSVYQKEDYYVIPQLVTSTIIMTDPLEENFIVNNPLKTQTDYIFMEFNEEDVKNIILNELPEKQSIDLMDWVLQNTKYEIVSFNPQALLFNIKATIELHRPQ